MQNCKTVAICNQKGGVGKTTTTVNLGVGLAREGKRMLLVDADPQGDLTTCLGWQNTDAIPITLATLDDLFSSQEKRDEAKLAKVRDIPLSEIDGFPNHPFKVRDDEDMLQLVENVPNGDAPEKERPSGCER